MITATAKANSSVKATCTIHVRNICSFTSEWLETGTLPCDNADSTVEVEYNNHYQTTAASSPGSGWTKTGTGTTKYEATGETREAPYPLSTSNTLVRAESKDYYYHWCRQGSSVVNFEQGPNYPTPHVAGAIDQFTIEGSGKDGDNPNIIWYQLRHKGRFENQLAWCDNGSNYVYYHMYVYDVRKAVTYYTWSKDSGWTTSPDSSAASVSYRYRLKEVLPTGLSLNKTSTTLGVGLTYTLTPTISPSNASNQNVTWSSSDTGVATVSSECRDGVICGKNHRKGSGNGHDHRSVGWGSLGQGDL